MRLGVISDTHGQVLTTQQAVRMFGSLRIDELIHCGDFGPAEMVALFSSWPSHFVFGNMDHAEALRVAIDLAGQTCHERFGQLHVEGRSIAFLHGDDEALLRQTINCGRWDLVCHGHTHRATEYSAGETMVVNPGAIHRTGCPTVAVIDLPALVVTPVAL